MNTRKSELSLWMWICAAAVTAAVLTGLLFWQPIPVIPPADAAQADMETYFKKAGIIQIPRIPPPMDFVLEDLHGRTHRLSDLKDKVVMLNFWATWCPECRVEMPAMQKLHQRFKGRGFVMLAVDLRESKETVRHFFDTYNLRFTALLDRDGQVGRRFGIRSIPTTFIIDQGGGIVGKAIGSRPWDSAAVAALFEQLINTPAEAQPVTGEQIREQ